MFAGCIEKKSADFSVSSNLLEQMSVGGLAKFPKKHSTCWESTFGESCNLTLIEQSIHENESLTIECVNDVLVVGWLRIDNKEELYSLLKLSNKTTDRRLIIELYEQFGERLCQHLYGDYSFVVIDLKKQNCLLCRDHMGVRPLYYYQDDKRLIFSTSMVVFFEFDSLKIKFSEEYIARYCASCATDWTLTAYEQLFKLQPAHVGVFSLKAFVNSSETNFQVAQILSIESYFQFDNDKRVFFDSEQGYIDRYKYLLDESVRCRVEDVDGALACESSGGIDSSTVTAIAAKHISSSEEMLHAFGFVTESQEEECIQMMSDYLHLNHTHLIKNNEEDNQLIQKAIDGFSDYSAMPITAHIAPVHAPIYHRAKSVGAKILLSGFGGDEFVTIYGATARVELFKRRQWNQWFSLFQGNFLTKKLRAFKWLSRFYINQNRFETAKSLLSLARHCLDNKVIKNAVSDKYGIEKIIINRSSYDAGCTSVNEFALKNRWSPDMVARLEECSLAAASCGLEYRWPLLDVRLIEFFLSVPAEFKLKNALPRYLHRKAIQGLVPEHLIWKDKDMGGPLMSQNDVLRSTEFNAQFNSAAMTFENLHPEVQSVIDKQKWLTLKMRLKDNISEDERQIIMQKMMFIMLPILSLSEWLKGFKKA